MPVMLRNLWDHSGSAKCRACQTVSPRRMCWQVSMKESEYQMVLLLVLPKLASVLALGAFCSRLSRSCLPMPSTTPRPPEPQHMQSFVAGFLRVLHLD